MNKKAEQGLVMNKIVVLILILLVIIAIIIGIWKFDIINKVGSLFPDFNRTSSENQELNNENNFSFCPVVIADIKDDYIYIEGTKTNLYLSSNKIKLDEEWDLFNKQIGIVDNHVINIYDSFFNSEEYEKYPELPSIEKLNLIDGSYRPSGHNYLCKEK